MGYLLRLFDRSLETVATVGFIGMLLAAGGQILFRYVLQISVPWTEELARVLFVLTMFLGIAIAIRHKEHIVVAFLFNKLSRRGQAVGLIIFDVAILLLLLLLAHGSLGMARITWNSYMIALDWLRTGHLYLAEFVALVIMMFYVALDIFTNVNLLRFGEKGNGDRGRS